MVRSASLAFVALACCLGAACAGSETQDLLGSSSSGRTSKDASSQDDDDDAGTSGDTGAGPFGPCDDEKEPNDDDDDANTLKTCLQGTVGASDAVDVLSLRIPKNAKSPTLTVTGVVHVEGESEDESFVIANTLGAPYASRSIPMSDAYVLRIASTMSNQLPSPWTIAFTAQ